MEVAVFALFSLLALVSAGAVVLHRNPVYAVMSLVVTLISTAVLFVLLGSPLLAVLQVLVYAGAILVLFLFVIMLLNIDRDEAAGGGNLGQKVFAVLAALGFIGVLSVLFWGSTHGLPLSPLEPDQVALKPIARELLSTYLLPFEIVGVLLLAAVIAATALAGKQTSAVDGGEDR